MLLEGESLNEYTKRMMQNPESLHIEKHAHFTAAARAANPGATQSEIDGRFVQEAVSMIWMGTEFQINGASLAEWAQRNMTNNPPSIAEVFDAAQAAGLAEGRKRAEAFLTGGADTPVFTKAELTAGKIPADILASGKYRLMDEPARKASPIDSGLPKVTRAQLSRGDYPKDGRFQLVD